jgi:hypothetical protein
VTTATLLAWTAAIAPVPAQDQRPPNAPEFGGSSPIGLVVILLLFIAVFFLIRSMNKHLKKVPASFDTEEQGGGNGPAGAEGGGRAPGAAGTERDGTERDGTHRTNGPG